MHLEPVFLLFSTIFLLLLDHQGSIALILRVEFRILQVKDLVEVVQDRHQNEDGCERDVSFLHIFYLYKRVL